MQPDGAMRVAPEQDVARRLVQRYGSKVLKAVRRYLPQVLRSKFDSHDFTQMAWLSAFRDPHRVEQFENSERFAAFVAGVAANKVRMALRRCGCQKCDVTRELALDAVIERLPAANQPRPSAAVAFQDELERMLAAYPEHYRQVLDLRSQGMTTWEIAQQAKLDETTVRHILRTMLQALRK